MATCTYCGEPAGLFKTAHQSCIEANQQKTNDTYAAWAVKLGEQCKAGGDAAAMWRDCVAAVPRGVADQLAQQVFIQRVEGFIQRGEHPSLETLNPLADFIAGTETDPRSLPGRTWPHFVMLAELADLAAGKFPNRADDPGLGFMYERGERFAWAFGGVLHLRDEVQHQRGLYAGVSMRVMPGLYSRLGTYQPGATVEGLVPMSQGNLVITDRAMWFQGEHGVQRTFLSDIAYIECFDDGFGFCAGRGSSRMEAYKTGPGEGWFSHALVTELAKQNP